MNMSMSYPVILPEALDAFAALSDATRLRIARVLIMSRREMCVCEIMDSVNETQNNVSRHLRILRQAGLITEGKRGKWVPYSIIDPPTGTFLAGLLQTVRLLPEGLFAADVTRMKARLSLRKNNECIIGINSDEWRKAIRKFPKGA
jgi:ArsR family transcriptional regulator